MRGRLREVDSVYQSGLARLIENHDEDRARTAFGSARGRAAAVLSLALPGLRLLHEGQMEGYQLHLPVRLGRRQAEATEPDSVDFHERLLLALRRPVFHASAWRLLEPCQVGRHLAAHPVREPLQVESPDAHRVVGTAGGEQFAV